MDRNARCRHHAILLGANVVAVDLLPHGDDFLAIDARRCTDRRDGLGERGRCATMQDSERLSRAFVHRHRGEDALVIEFDDLDAEYALQSW